MKKRIIEAVAVMLSLTTLVLFSACVGKNNGASGGKTTDTSHGVVTARITSLQSVVTEPSGTQKTGADTSFGGGDVSESKGAAVSTDDTKYSDPTVDASSAVSESGKGQTEPSSYGSQTTAETTSEIEFFSNYSKFIFRPSSQIFFNIAPISVENEKKS